MIIAIIRTEKCKLVKENLANSGFYALTEMSVRGRGKQKGITIGEIQYDMLPKDMLMIVCKEEDVKTIKEIISSSAKTGQIGDGKIFVIDVEDAMTIRTGEQE